MDEAKTDGREPGPEELVLELNFVPDWARGPASHTVIEQERDHRPRRDTRDAPPRTGKRPPRRDAAGRGGPITRGRSQDRQDARPRRQDDRQERRPVIQAAPVTVRLLPEQHNLATIVRKVSTSRRAYPLVNIAYLFLDNPDACEVRIEPEGGPKSLTFYQCTVCRTVCLREPDLDAHVLGAHMSDYFDVEEIETEAPSGQFSCVCRCRLSGEFLGPPNHHTFSARLQELHRTRFPNMPLAQYREKIEVCREPELIEQWKQAARKELRYTLKKESESFESPADQATADAYFRERIVPRLSRKTHRAVLPLSVARALPDEGMRQAVLEAEAKEKRFPLSLLFAMRSAFRHMNLHVFKTGGQQGAHFVCARKPVPLDPEHVVDSIRQVLSHLHKHPGCTKANLLEALCPSEQPDSDAVRSLMTHLNWLSEKGHVIEFFNGTLAVPLKSGRRT